MALLKLEIFGINLTSLGQCSAIYYVELYYITPFEFLGTVLTQQWDSNNKQI